MGRTAEEEFAAAWPSKILMRPYPEESFGGGRLSKEQRPKEADERAVVNMEAGRGM